MAAVAQDALARMTDEELIKLITAWRSFLDCLDLGGVIAELVEPPSVAFTFFDVQAEIISRRDAVG